MYLTLLFSIFLLFYLLFFFNATATTKIYTLSLHDALPIYPWPDEGYRPPPMPPCRRHSGPCLAPAPGALVRSEEHTSELQSLRHLVCRLLLEKKKKKKETKIKLKRNREIRNGMRERTVIII